MTDLDIRIRAEWDTLRSVAIHEHENLEQILRHDFHVNVYRMRDTIVNAAGQNHELYDRLVKAAHKALRVAGEKDAIIQLEKNMDNLDVDFFFNILLNPRIESESENGKGMIHVSIVKRQPLSDIFYMRDQQAITDKGIFLSRMSNPQRRHEPSITRILWDVLGGEVVHTVTDPGTFEGGDFIPLKDFALVGVGKQTNQSGIEQILKYGLGFDEIGVVHQPNNTLLPSDEADPMIDMHLDTYFNIASRSVAVGLKPLLQEAMVDIYNRVGPGEYEKEKEGTNLLSYITDWGFDVVGLTTLEQLSCASNFLTVRDGTILTVEVEPDIKNVLLNLQMKAKEEPERYGGLLTRAEMDYELLKEESEFFPNKRELYQHGIDAYPLILKNHNEGNCAAHRLTAALERR